MRLPKVPDKYFPDFLRGYFDGDGNVFFGYFRKADRKSLSRAFLTRFTSGSRLFLVDIQKKLSTISITGSLFAHNGAWLLSYSGHASEKLFQLMYRNGNVSGLIYLERKYRIFKDALASKEYCGRSSIG